MESLIGTLAMIISLVLMIVFFVIAYRIGSISSTLKEMQVEQQKIYKALYLMAQAQGVGKKPEEVKQ